MNQKLCLIVMASLLVVVGIDAADALKSEGTKNKQYGSATSNIVCGDRLCSDIIPIINETQSEHHDAPIINEEH